MENEKIHLQASTGDMLKFDCRSEEFFYVVRSLNNFWRDMKGNAVGETQEEAIIEGIKAIRMKEAALALSFIYAYDILCPEDYYIFKELPLAEQFILASGYSKTLQDLLWLDITSERVRESFDELLTGEE
jgi:hypothetical protein